MQARTEAALLEAAAQLMRAGRPPSITEVAEVAGVSRATAYRYFPSQAALVDAVVRHSLGPVLTWSSGSADPETRLDDLFSFTYARLETYEVELRAVLQISLEQWARDRAGSLGNEARVMRGNRRALMQTALEPLRSEVGEERFDRLVKAVSILFGIEIFVVLKDIWNLELDEIQEVAAWMCHTLVRTTREEVRSPASQGGSSQEG